MKFLIITLLFFSFQLFAHQPKLITYSPSYNNPHEINNPEISKAFYGTLKGNDHYYKISSENNFLFYAGILSPKINDTYQWFSLDILDNNNKIIFSADGSNFDWQAWYEPYARDWYWKGPEIGLESNTEFKTSLKLKSGTYLIRVFNNDKKGHYSLAVGEAEFFGSNLWEKILTWTPIILFIGPYMDIVHWSKFDVRAFMPHFFLLVIFYIFYYLLKIFLRQRL